MLKVFYKIFFYQYQSTPSQHLSRLINYDKKILKKYKRQNLVTGIYFEKVKKKKRLTREENEDKTIYVVDDESDIAEIRIGENNSIKLDARRKFYKKNLLKWIKIRIKNKKVIQIYKIPYRIYRYNKQTVIHDDMVRVETRNYHYILIKSDLLREETLKLKQSWFPYFIEYINGFIKWNICDDGVSDILIYDTKWKNIYPHRDEKHWPETLQLLKDCFGWRPKHIDWLYYKGKKNVTSVFELNYKCDHRYPDVYYRPDLMEWIFLEAWESSLKAPLSTIKIIGKRKWKALPHFSFNYFKNHEKACNTNFYNQNLSFFAQRKITFKNKRQVFIMKWFIRYSKLYNFIYNIHREYSKTYKILKKYLLLHCIKNKKIISINDVFTKMLMIVNKQTGNTNTNNINSNTDIDDTFENTNRC